MTSPNRQMGFTLVELLAAMTITALLGLTLLGMIRYAGIMTDRVVGADDFVESDQLAAQFLRAALVGAYPSFVGSGTNAAAQPAFTGRADFVQFLGPAPAAMGGAGLALFTLRLVPDGQAYRLELSTRMELARPDAPILKSAVLLKGVRAVDFSYFGVRGFGTPAAWGPLWTGQPHLPQLVRIRIDFTDRKRVWPELIVASRVEQNSGCIFDAASHQCDG